MALTWGRWVALLIAGCGLIGVALLPPPGRSDKPHFQPPDRELRDRFQVQSLLVEAEHELDRARLSRAIDSLAPTIPWNGDVPFILPIGGAPDPLRDTFAVRIARSWKGTAEHSPIRIALVLAGDSGHRQWEKRYRLPTKDQSICVVSFRTMDWLRQAPDDRNFFEKASSELGPCLLYRIYGRPGTGIERWITGPGVSYADRFDPEARRPAEPPRPPEGLWNQEISWAVYGSSAAELLCLRGELDRCEDAIIPDQGTGTEPPAGAGAFITPTFEWRTPFRGASGDYLSDLRSAMGDERFRRFWQSDLPVKEAFKEAFNSSLGQWTHDWITTKWFAFHPGPLPAPRSAAYAGGLLLIFLGASLVIGGRRGLVR